LTLSAYRHPRTERLVALLATRMAAEWPTDPFARTTIVVGSRGMERWLRAELATRHGSAAGIDFVFPGPAFAQWMTMVFAAAGVDPAPLAAHGWSRPSLTFRVLRALGARRDDPVFARVRRFVGEEPPRVDARAWGFATEVAAVVERLHYDRPDQALAWSKEPQHVLDPDHRWLAYLLADLDATSQQAPSPANQLATLRALSATGGHPPLFVFGLSSLRPGDKQRLVALAQHVDIHLFALVPSLHWWADIRSQAELRRALRTATTPHERETLLERLKTDNPLLSACGAPSRDLQLWLEEVGYQSFDDDDENNEPSSRAPHTRLRQLQQFIATAADAPTPETPWSDEDVADTQPGVLPTIELHACHGPLRQCEALRDELLRRFAADPTLHPHHVLVMTPDLATYAPLVAAVFAREDEDIPAIPVHIADLGLRDENVIAATLLEVIGFVDERLTASRLLAFLDHEPVRTKFRLGDEDLSALRDLIVQAGLRWAFDAADRARHDQPAVEEHTVRFALERLALGVLMPDPGGSFVLPQAHGLGPALPIELSSREQSARFGVLAAVCRALQEALGNLATPASPQQWRQRLKALVETFCAVDDERAWQRQQVTQTFTDVLSDDTKYDDDQDEKAPLLLSASAVASMLKGAFTMPQRGDRPVTGAVTVCSMEPMRSVPFRVIALLGMDDGVFPRMSRLPAWDPFAIPAKFEHDRRSLDRHLFLESILCARDALLVFGRGFESTRGARIPLSIVVEELRELLQKAWTPLAARAHDQAGPTASGSSANVADSNNLPATQERWPGFRDHPLQPFSPRCFADNARLPFGSQVQKAARARQQPARKAGLAASTTTAPWPQEHTPPTRVTARVLARSLENAPACLLEQALGVRLSGREAELVDREPLELDARQMWVVRDRLLTMAQDPLSSSSSLRAASVMERLRAAGALPVGAGGDVVFQNEVESIESILERQRQLGPLVAHRLTWGCTVAGAPRVFVSAIVPEVRVDPKGRRVHVWATPSKVPADKLVLEAWFALLVAVAVGEDPACACLVGARKESDLTLQALPVPEALAVLQQAVDTWHMARRMGVPLVPVFSRALAQRAHEEPTALAKDLVRDTWDEWFVDESSRRRTAMDDIAVAAIYDDVDEDDLLAQATALVEHANRVWGPVIAAQANETPSAFEDDKDSAQPQMTSDPPPAPPPSPPAGRARAGTREKKEVSS
jgi:exodeoxyribonuclease V gamma subunit